MAEIIFEKSEDEVAKGSKKFLGRGLYDWPVVQVTGKKTNSGNFALSIGFETGYQNKDKTDKIVDKTYYLLDKKKGYKEIDQKQLNRLRDDLIACFGISWNGLTTIRDTVEIAKLNALAGRLTSSEHAIVGKTALVTYDWPNDGYPNGDEGQYYLEVRFINSAEGDRSWIEGKWDAKRKNPNPPKTAAASTHTANQANEEEADDENTSAVGADPEFNGPANIGSKNEPDDLPF